MDSIFELIKEINVMQLIAFGIILWFFYNRLDQKIDKSKDSLNAKIDAVNNSLNARIDKLDAKIDGVNNCLTVRIDRLSDKVEGLDRRLCRIEGSLATQGHCLFNQAHKERQAE